MIHGKKEAKPVKTDWHRPLPFGREPEKKPQGTPPKPTPPSPKNFKIGDIKVQISSEGFKEKLQQPGLFDGIDEVITALQIEENDLTDTLKKLIEAKSKAEEKIEALEGRVDVLSSARKKAEKWLEKKK